MKMSSLISRFVLLAALLFVAALSSVAQADCPLCQYAERTAADVERHCDEAGGPVDVNGKTGTGQTAVLLAAKAENSEVLNVLLNGRSNCARAHPDIENVGGRTPYMWAAQRGNTGIANDLIAEGRENVPEIEVRVNFAKLDGRNAADIAAEVAVEKGRSENITFLIQQIVRHSINFATDDPHRGFAERGPLTSIELGEFGRFLTAHKMLINMSVDDAFLQAAREGNLGAVKGLIRFGADVHHTDDVLSRTALHFAANEGHENVVSFLLNDLRMHVDVLDRDAFTPLHDAAYSADGVPDTTGVVRLLIDAGADLNLRDRLENAIVNTPLELAARSNNSGVVRLLLDQGDRVELNGQSPVTGMSSFHWAIAAGNLDSVSRFLQRDDLGVNLLVAENLPGGVSYSGLNDGVSPLLMAVGTPDSGDNYDMVELLFSHPSLTIDIDAFADAARYRNLRILNAFIDDLDKSDPYGTERELLGDVVYTLMRDIVVFDDTGDSRISSLTELLKEFEIFQVCQNVYMVEVGGQDIRFLQWRRRLVGDELQRFITHVQPLMELHANECIASLVVDPDAGSPGLFSSPVRAARAVDPAEPFELDPDFLLPTLEVFNR